MSIRIDIESVLKCNTNSLVLCVWFACLVNVTYEFVYQVRTEQAF